MNQASTTKEFAATVKVEPATIRRSLCLKGHYLGVKPLKLDNGRLLWPTPGIEKIMRGEKVEATGGIEG